MPHPDGSGRLIPHALYATLKPQYDARRAAFEAGPGRLTQTEDGRAAIEAARMAQTPVDRVEIAAPVPKYKGGLTEAQVERFVANAEKGETTKHGGEHFEVPRSSVYGQVSIVPVDGYSSLPTKP